MEELINSRLFLPLLAIAVYLSVMLFVHHKMTPWLKKQSWKKTPHIHIDRQKFGRKQTVFNPKSRCKKGIKGFP